MRNGHFITDYHCHSTVSPDGHNTMREMAEAAVRLGVDDLCFTDHIEPLPWDRWNEPPKEKHSYDWAPMLAQFREAQEAVGGRIKLHMGVELGECSFAPDVADSFLDDAPPLDFTIGSVHCYRTASGEVNDLTWITSTDPAVWYAACESYFEEMEKLIHDAETYQFQELSKRVKEAIDTLPASYREAFVMHRFTKKSYKEIAESSGVSVKTIAYRIQQATKLLRKDLADLLITMIVCVLLVVR